MKDDNLGIPSIGFEYQKIRSDQNPVLEYKKTLDFLIEVFKNKIKIVEPGLNKHEIKIQFINYGDTQLVYVASLGDEKYAVLVGQPANNLGEVKEEFDNLNKLSQQNPDLIVKSKYYFSNDCRELYIAPYFYQARCIASQEKGWGIYIPEPYYRFELFNEEELHLICSCMIANLIRLYDENEKKGLKLVEAILF